ncbi:MAG: excinuclease ABC subunit C [Candidatus Deianiraeaceae bacterium]|jgi:excinuclease ABC subunit C
MSVEVIKLTTQDAPQKSGVYKMYDVNNIIVYIGKAKNIQKRLQSYTSNDVPPKTRTLVACVVKVEFEITPTENHALILEASLVKRLQPKYNILLKDDKSRVYIKISNHDFPAIGRYRGKFDRKSRLFGPFGYIYGSSLTTHDVIKRITNFVCKVFKVRSCKDTKFKVHHSMGKPCMEYQIGTCSAPCVGIISHNEYSESVENAIKFLHGGYSKVYRDIKMQITRLAKNCEFADAQKLKNQLFAIESLKSQVSNLDFTKYESLDVIVISEDMRAIEVFAIRNGYALGGNLFKINAMDGKVHSDVLEDFLYQYYSVDVPVNPPPKKIFVNYPVNNINVYSVFESLFKTKASVSNPKSSDGKVLIDFALENLQFQIQRQVKEDNVFSLGMERIAQAFHIQTPLMRIEVYDNSHISGAFFLGAFIVASPNGFDTSQYRKFNAKFSKGGDDYAMMREVMIRRFHEKSSIKEKPDLLIIDGGIGQFRAVTQILDVMRIDIPVIAIAKGKDRNAGNETFFTRQNIKGFKIANKDLLYFIERLRDEAHRFVITSHRKRREKIYTVNPK